MSAEAGHFVTSDGTRLAYRLHRPATPGTGGVPLVMVQGLSATQEDWRGLEAALARGRVVATLDNRGIGGSDVPAGPYPTDRMAQDVLELAAHLGWHRCNVMGISMGGMIAQRCALQAPHRVARLVLGCTTMGGRSSVPAGADFLRAFVRRPGESVRDVTARVLAFNFTPAWVAANEARFAAIVDATLRTKRPAAGIAAQMQGASSFDASKSLAAIRSPTLVVHGTDDLAMPYANAELLHRGIAGSRLLRLEGSGHMFWDMDGGRSADEVARFLAEGDACPAAKPAKL